jgi:hypothetical protein
MYDITGVMAKVKKPAKKAEEQKGAKVKGNIIYLILSHRGNVLVSGVGVTGEKKD